MGPITQFPLVGVCEVCERQAGCMLDRGREYDGVPLGPLEKCDLCGKWACPDCLHEVDCCFDRHEFGDVPPPGWHIETEEKGLITYQRDDADVTAA